MAAASTIGERIKAVRLRSGVAQERFASTLGYTRRALLNWEQGIAEPPIAILAKLRQQYDVDPEWVVLGEDTVPRSRHGGIDRERFGRCKDEVDAACTQVGMDLGEDTRRLLIYDLYDDDPAFDEANRKRLRQMLLAMSKGKLK